MDSFPKNKRIDVLVRGYFVYGLGGYYRIAEKPVETTDEEGTHYLEIPEYMVRKFEEAPDWEDGAWLVVSNLPGKTPETHVILRFCEGAPKPYRMVNQEVTGTYADMAEMRERLGPDIKVQQMYVEMPDG